MPRRKKQITNEPETKQLSPVHQDNPTAKLWLWAGVGGITIIILALWVWAFSIRLSSFNWSKTPEDSLLKRSQTDWDTLFKNEESKAKNEQLKSQLKNILNKIVTAENSPSSSASTTIIISSSTINTSSPKN